MTLKSWQFIDENGTFHLENPDGTGALYFPLVNEAGMMANITPAGHGDAKTGHNTFLLGPVSIDDLHDRRSARNFWVRINGHWLWSATGGSAEQTVRRFSSDKDQTSLNAGLLWHRMERTHAHSGLKAEVTSFVPASTEHRVELMGVRFQNNGASPLTLSPMAAIPIFGRSAENLRDHRHVTSLLQRISCSRHGVSVRPSLSFDERGHTVNTTTYAVFGVDDGGSPPTGFYPVLETFIGEGGALDWPQALAACAPPPAEEGSAYQGYEALGGLSFAEIELEPGEEKAYILILAILEDHESSQPLLESYGSWGAFERALEETKSFWMEKVSTLRFETGEARRDGWLKWLVVQPTLRRLMGNSFLPYHDYGRGGRGWRDLWQDILALLMMESGPVDEMLLGHFAGVRLDGSNATIIGSQPGDFKADRNGIPRVWMDHGTWPLLTTRLYLDQTGDLDFLLREQVYFKDSLTHRCQKTDEDWSPDQGTLQKTASGSPYSGTVLEHFLVQHLTAFFNVGEHNNILLEGADWNDALDMARQRGESVAFTALYAGNLCTLSELCLALVERGGHEINLASELAILLQPVNFESISMKQEQLQAYFDRVRHMVSGEKVTYSLADLAARLMAMYTWLAEHIRRQEWIEDGQGHGWFNGYYDDHGERVEGLHAGNMRMTLTGQVFTLMGGVATDEQAHQVVRSADHYLYDQAMRGYRLNTDFGQLLLNLGRAYGFAYGHKENGALFNHMSVMYANALYQRGLAQAGWRVMEGIYQQSQDFERSRIYPGIPEYFNPTGRGMYTYLTGSASWYLLTLLREVYGVRGRLGDLALEPRLLARQFGATGEAAVQTLFAGKKLRVVYENPQILDYGQYRVGQVRVGSEEVAVEAAGDGVILRRSLIEALPQGAEIRVGLIAK